MSVEIESSADIRAIQMAVQVSDPATPAADCVKIYVKGAELYVIDDADAVTRVLSSIAALSTKTQPVLGDEMVLSDSEASNALKSAGIELFTPFARVALYDQTADIAATDISADSYFGLYRVSYYLVTSTIDAAAGSVTLTISSNDGYSARSQTTAALSLAAAGAVSGEFVVQAGDTNAIKYATAHTGSYGTAKYDLRLTVQLLAF